MSARCGARAGLALALGLALAARLASGDEAPLAAGLEVQASGARGARISTRLERLAARDWSLGPLAIRPFARALVEGGRVTVRRPLVAPVDAPAPETPAAESGGASATAALHRLAEGLAGRELVEFRIRGFRFEVFRGDERRLALDAEDARVEREGGSLELRAIRGDTAAGQRLEAGRLRLRWDPERLDMRGRWLLCDGAGCTRGRDGALAFDPASGRLVAQRRAPTGRADPGQREQHRQP